MFRRLSFIYHALYQAAALPIRHRLLSFTTQLWQIVVHGELWQKCDTTFDCSGDNSEHGSDIHDESVIRNFSNSKQLHHSRRLTKVSNSEQWQYFIVKCQWETSNIWHVAMYRLGYTWISMHFRKKHSIYLFISIPAHLYISRIFGKIQLVQSDSGAYEN